MQKRSDESYLLSPTDLVNFLGCSHAIVLISARLRSRLSETRPLKVRNSSAWKGDDHGSRLPGATSAGKSVSRWSAFPKTIPQGNEPDSRWRRCEMGPRLSIRLCWKVRAGEASPTSSKEQTSPHRSVHTPTNRPTPNSLGIRKPSISFNLACIPDS